MVFTTAYDALHKFSIAARSDLDTAMSNYVAQGQQGTLPGQYEMSPNQMISLFLYDNTLVDVNLEPADMQTVSTDSIAHLMPNTKYEVVKVTASYAGTSSAGTGGDTALLGSQMYVCFDDAKSLATLKNYMLNFYFKNYPYHTSASAYMSGGTPDQFTTGNSGGDVYISFNTNTPGQIAFPSNVAIQIKALDSVAAYPDYSGVTSTGANTTAQATPVGATAGASVGTNIGAVTDTTETAIPIGDAIEGNPAATGSLDTTIDAVPDTTVDPSPPATQDGTPDMSIPSALVSRFPFCLPWDMYYAVKGLVAAGKAPSFDIPFGSYSVHIDLAVVQPVVPLVRWGLSILFLLGLIVLTTIIIRH